MSAPIDLHYLAESQPSLCIPRVFNNIEESRIRQVFDSLGLGKIHHIDMVARKNEKGEAFKRVYIHFEKWFWNEAANMTRTKLVSGKEIKIVYDNPWFWKVSANKWTTPTLQQPEPRRQAQPYIDFGECETKSQMKIAPALGSGPSVPLRPPNPRPPNPRPPNPRPNQRPNPEAKLSIDVKLAEPLSPPETKVKIEPHSPTFPPPEKSDKERCFADFDVDHPVKNMIPDIEYGAISPPRPKLLKKKAKKVVVEKKPVDELYGDL